MTIVDRAWETRTPSRRQLLARLGAASALTLLTGCEDLIEGAVNSCPSDPAESGGVTWIPDIGHPLFWGFQELSAANGAPRDMRVYYPTVAGSPEGAPIVRLCITRYPVVLFLHGQPPNGIPLSGYHRRWFLLPAVLARSGYVVVVPNHAAQIPNNDFGAAVNAAMQDINFVRTGWSESKWVDKRATSTAVVGHSFGALLAARVAAANPDIGAFVSLSGGFLELSNPLPALQAVTAPSFFMWAKGDSIGLAFEDLDASAKLWDKLAQNKYAAIFQGEHFDYLPAGDTAGALRGPCSLVGGAAADLAALFISSVPNLKVSVSRTDIPVDLQPPQVQLTREQEFFAGAHLQGIGQFQSSQGCRIDMRWKVNGTTGSRRIGP